MSNMSLYPLEAVMMTKACWLITKRRCTTFSLPEAWLNWVNNLPLPLPDLPFLWLDKKAPFRLHTAGLRSDHIPKVPQWGPTVHSARDLCRSSPLGCHVSCELVPRIPFSRRKGSFHRSRKELVLRVGKAPTTAVDILNMTDTCAVVL